MRRALVSVADKTGVVELVRGLIGLGFEIVSTGGTARTLEQAGLAVVPVSSVTGFPELMDGRVKTLHPAIHAGILARRDRADDLASLDAHRLSTIDLVAVNLYPFAEAARRPETTFDALIEEIDIGGPALVRAAAKNFRGVIVVVDPSDYPRVLAALARPGGPEGPWRLELAAKAFRHTAGYDQTIAATLAEVTHGPEGFVRGAAGVLPAPWLHGLPLVRQLRYGENPHQKGSWYALPGVEAGFSSTRVLQGKELSYTNLLDLDAASRLVREFEEPAAAVVKHTNPCGAAVGSTAADAYIGARDADPLSAFGGVVALNRPIDADAARAIASTFIEAVIAPRVEEAARAVLAAKSALRVLEADFSHVADVDVRSIAGALLCQDRDGVEEARGAWPLPDGSPRVVTTRAPSDAEWEALRFAWRVCAHVKSNAIVFTARDRTLAIGAGQMSRVDAVKVAVMKAGATLAGSVAASDAFFPFRDGLDAIAAAGATAVVQPGGSVRDAEVIAAADEHGLAMVFTGRRHFRH
jgi:phosphoribosylaminoimidazolecarboxamide formyltransferase/IMP cyclohydrolase